jgi:acetyltransferase-like isoleucine patch superfamily enzyme
VFESMKLGDTTGMSKREIVAKVAELRLPWPLAMLSRLSVPLIGVAIWVLPAACAALVVTEVFEHVRSPLWRAAGCSVAILVFGVSFVVVAGLFSRIGQPGIVAGKFPRRADHPVYALRRIYGLCWTQLYYFRQLYAFCLAMPWMKWLMFRLFGVRGTLHFSVFPDCWLRDLPLLSIGEGAYLANRSTLGTNICLKDGSILVGPITLQARSMVGHLAVFGLGTTLGEGAEIGVAVTMGINITVGNDASINPTAGINHGATIGNGTTIDAAAYVGQKAQIGPGLKIHGGATIPAGAVIQTQAEADSYFSSENQALSRRSVEVLDMVDYFAEEDWPGRRKQDRVSR